MAEPFRVVEGVAASLPAPNIDTDIIMPKQFLRIVDRTGLAQGVFHDLRFDGEGRERTGFILNQIPWRAACILIAGPNFGCGSSREHAVWGLVQCGIRVIIGRSFAGIFADNAAQNGLLLIEIADDALLERLSAQAGDADHCRIRVDLETQRIFAAGMAPISFAIEPLRRARLLEGRDAIAATLDFAGDIDRFEAARGAEWPWLPVAGRRDRSESAAIGEAVSHGA